MQQLERVHMSRMSHRSVQRRRLLSYWLHGKQQGGRRLRCALNIEELENRITPSFTLSTLAHFSNTTINGFGYASNYNVSGLVRDNSGNLYGTTLLGGAFDDGTVFELPQGSYAIQTLASFDGSNGQ